MVARNGGGSRFDFDPYLDFLFTNLLLGNEGEEPFDRSLSILLHAIYRNCPRDVPKQERRFIGRNLVHLVNAFPDKARKTGGRDERHYFAVAQTLAEFGADWLTIASGFYHDYTEERLDDMLHANKNESMELIEQQEENPEILIRVVGDELQDWLRWNLRASYSRETMSDIETAHMARRIVAINYKLTRNPKNVYLASMQHLLFPMQGTFTFDTLIKDLEQHNFQQIAAVFKQDEHRYGDKSRRELEFILAEKAQHGIIPRAEAYRTRMHFGKYYRTQYNLQDIIRVCIVKCADRIENTFSLEQIEQRDAVNGNVPAVDNQQAGWLRELLQKDQYHAKEIMRQFYADHPPRDIENYGIAYQVAKTLLLTNVAKLFIMANFGVSHVDGIGEIQPELYAAYTKMIEITRHQIAKTRIKLGTKEERNRRDVQVREYEEAGFLDERTTRTPSSRRDLRQGYYGLHGTLDQYIAWMNRRKEDMEAHSNRPARLDLDLAAFDRVFEKLLIEPDHYFIRGFTERAEQELYLKRRELQRE
ncbi:hypothetical protein HY488_01365 [Candidatus Woesearchaeota archaeon]|nr:hypothetical protein [Candidatus Woesearchaeota archaeon]